jgi:Raf kinase inhibitor-like YbhB/YbcL family protein
MAFTVTSSAFAEGQPVPRQFTCDGDDAPPPLTVKDPPNGTKSFAVIADDPDAPSGTFTHWLAYDIPAEGHAVRASAGKTLKNDFGRKGYGGPCPPAGHGTHRYYFTVYAVDAPALHVSRGSRDDLEAALKDHTLAKARLMGRYERAK